MVRKWHQGVQIVWCTSGTQHQEESCTRYLLWTFTRSKTNATRLRHCGLNPHLNVQITPIYPCRFFCKGFVHVVHSYFGFEGTRLRSIWEGLHKNRTLLLSSSFLSHSGTKHSALRQKVVLECQPIDSCQQRVQNMLKLFERARNNSLLTMRCFLPSKITIQSLQIPRTLSSLFSWNMILPWNVKTV